MSNKSIKKVKVYFIIAQILFWYSFICGVTYPLAPLRGKVNLFSWMSAFSGAMTFNPLVYISLLLFWRSAKNLSNEEFSKRKFWSKYFPKYIVILFIVGLVVTLLLLVIPFLTSKR